jgi:hypothetical protein
MDNVYFKPCDWSLVSRRCSWRFLAKFKSDQPVSVQPSKWAFEGVRTPPQCLEDSALQTSGRQGNTVRTLGQASPTSTPSWISVDTYLESFCKTSRRRGNTSGCYPAFQNILGFLYKREKERQWRPSRRSAKPFGREPVMGRIELFWKGGRRRPSGRG